MDTKQALAEHLCQRLRRKILEKGTGSEQEIGKEKITHRISEVVLATGMDLVQKQATSGAMQIMLNMTNHARVRIQQRGIPSAVVEKLLEFGIETYDHRGGLIVYFNRRARENLRRAYGTDLYKRIEAHLDAYAVVTLSGDIVTVGHRVRRIIHN